MFSFYLSVLLNNVQSSGTHDEFLISRILFLVTYVREYLNWGPIVHDQGLSQVINEKLSQHAARYTSKQRATLSINPMDDNALKETSTLLFNIAHLNPQTSSAFSSSITSLFAIINSSSKTQGLQQPISAVLNALLPLDEESSEWKSAAFPESDPILPSSKIIAIMASALKQFTEQELENQGTPIITLVHKLYSTAPDAVKAHIQTTLLPSDTDRAQVLGQSDTLSSQLLRLSMTGAAPTLRATVGNLLYELSDKDPSTLVGNVGFGIASGYLMRNGIALPNTPGSQEAASGVDINPITGQRRDAEIVADEPPMTAEEQEREAERLFVLFERFVDSAMSSSLCMVISLTNLQAQ
jgi:Guanine nucleotide exchange factor synembryn